MLNVFFDIFGVVGQFIARTAVSVGKGLVRGFAESVLLGLSNIFIVLSGIFTLVGVIGFHSTASNVKYVLPSLSLENDAAALGSIIDNILRNALFIRFGTVFVCLFAICAVILSLANSQNPLFPIFSAAAGIAGFVLSFKLSAYCSVRKMLEAGLDTLIQPEKILAIAPINIIMALSVAQIAFVVLGGVLFAED